MSEIERVEVSAYRVDIFICGGRSRIETLLAAYCERGACVRLSETEYIYTFGQEAGFVVGLINYARFPKTKAELFAQAEDLARQLLLGLNQGSCSVVSDDRSVWLTRRND